MFKTDIEVEGIISLIIYNTIAKVVLKWYSFSEYSLNISK